MSIVKRESQGKCDFRRESQGDREGRPYNTRMSRRSRSMVGATLAVALARTRLRSQIVVALLLAFSLMACDGPTINFGGTATPTASGLPGNAQLNTWYAAARGVDVRYEDWKTPDGTEDDTVTIVRVDPHNVTLSVGYRPDKPLLMSQWMQQEHATAIINGGYFDQNDRATALVISNGQTYGSTYSSFGGMLSVDSNGRINLRSLNQQPYDPSESLTQAVQSSPMLVVNGKRTSRN